MSAPSWIARYRKQHSDTVKWVKYTATAKCEHCGLDLHAAQGNGPAPRRARTVRVLHDAAGGFLPLHLCRYHAAFWSNWDDE